ncbi:MAG TPA: cyclase family protein [Conexibacter sp.]|jgi:kynurenine formamidase
MNKVVDVSHALWSGMPRIPVLPEVEVCPVMEIAHGAPLNISMLHVATHAGTHIDAPSHAIAGARSIDEIPPERFIGTGVVVGVRRGAGEEITVEDMLAGGPRPQRGEMVLLSTGWDELFQSDDYHDHPALSPALARWLVEEGVTLVGVDCITVDLPVARRPAGFDFPVHRTLLGAEVLIAENLRGLAPLVGARVRVYGQPIAVRGGDGGHVRMLVQELDESERAALRT